MKTCSACLPIARLRYTHLGSLGSLIILIVLRFGARVRVVAALLVRTSLLLLPIILLCLGSQPCLGWLRGSFWQALLLTSTRAVCCRLWGRWLVGVLGCVGGGLSCRGLRGG